MKTVSIVIQWIFALFILIFITVSKTHYSSLFFVAAAVLMMPIPAIRNKLSELGLKNWLLVLIAIVLSFVGILATPTTPNDSTEEISNTESSSTADNQSLTVSTDDNSIIEDSTSIIVIIPPSSSNTTQEISIETESSIATESSIEIENSTEIESSTEIENSEPESSEPERPELPQQGVNESNPKFNIENVPKYSGFPYYIVNNNEPTFSKNELTTESYEYYSELDSLGRCGIVIASIGKDIMPTEERGSIGSIKPSGWHTVKYDIVDGKYLYNRCHLIGYQLTGENANTKNLITGTRYLNIDGMLPFENMVADYIIETNNHVAYRVTPIFENDNMLASGVQIEAYSIEDQGDGICFNVFCYNVQPGIEINYADGSSKLIIDENQSSEENESSEQQEPVKSEEISEESSNEVSSDSQDEPSESEKITYVLNTNTHKFHEPNCRHVKTIKEKNYEETTKTREEVIEDGYDPCGTCKP